MYESIHSLNGSLRALTCTAKLVSLVILDVTASAVAAVIATHVPLRINGLMLAADQVLIGVIFSQTELTDALAA